MSFAILLGAALPIKGYLGGKIYRVEVVLAPVGEDGIDSSLSQLTRQFAGPAALLGMSIGSAGRNEDVAIATLRSRRFTADWLKEENLLPVIFSDSWDEKKGTWRKTIFGRVPTLPHAVDVFDQNIRSVNQDRRTGLVRLAIEWKDPEVAAEWAMKNVSRVNELLRSQAVTEAERSIEFLSKEAAKSNLVGVQQASYGLIEMQLNRITLANVRSEYAFRVVDPAVPPDPRDYVRPRLTMLAILGAGFGGAFGILVLLILARARGDVRS